MRGRNSEDRGTMELTLRCWAPPLLGVVNAILNGSPSSILQAVSSEIEREKTTASFGQRPRILEADGERLTAG